MAPGAALRSEDGTTAQGAVVPDPVSLTLNRNRDAKKGDAVAAGGAAISDVPDPAAINNVAAARTPVTR